MKYLATLAASLIAGATVVSAHGNVNHTVIDNILYDGFNVDYPHHPKIFRSLAGIGPVVDLFSIDIQCGGDTPAGKPAGAPAPLTAPVTAGSTVSMRWDSWPGSHLGPVIVYMARCPGSCSTYEPGEDAVWFKIAHSGKLPPGSWVMPWASFPITNKRPFEFTIPTELAPGNYIIRQEIIALQSARQYPGAEVHPACFQVSVQGDGDAVPTPESLVSFPGTYSPETPGIVYDIYLQNNPQEYVIPGPPIATLVSEGAQ